MTDTERDLCRQLSNELYAELTDNILPFWMGSMTDPAGGFYGERDGSGRLVADAPKGAILNARILWSFAAAYRVLRRPEYLVTALRARDYLVAHFYDREFGGVFWSVDSHGAPLDTRKQFYALGFALYGMAELLRANPADETARRYATLLLDDIVGHSRDAARGGYIEALTRDWQPLDDMRLSEKDANTAKTMNTHLHIIEPFANLLRAEPDNAELQGLTRELLLLFLDRITDSRTGHLGLFFTADWHREDATISYGHDIEASWLLLESAQTLGDPALLRRTLAATRRMGMAALEGLAADGSMIYERHASGDSDNERHWWVQAECFIGELYLWRYHGMPEMLGRAAATWRYIRDNIVDRSEGEWLWSRRADGTANRADDKAGFWKCPYHNTRMCLEGLNILAQYLL